jgi:hypothetical protein
MKNLILGCLFTSLSLVAFAALSETQVLRMEAGADNTLYEDPDGAVSNGSGAFMLAGRNNLEQNSIRRAVLYFDVAGQLPHGAVVEQASLHLYLERGNGGQRVLNLHRLVSDWGEGDSVVTGGGLGAPAQEGDATWLHSFYPDAFWGRDGGRYVGRVSASQTVGDPVVDELDMPGFYTWGSSDRMVDDVRRWQRHPEQNFGWILLGDETVPQTVKRFSSRDNVDPDLRPVLEVHYSLPE